MDFKLHEKRKQEISFTVLIPNGAGKGNDSMLKHYWHPTVKVPGRALPWVDYKTRKGFLRESVFGTHKYLDGHSREWTIRPVRDSWGNQCLVRTFQAMIHVNVGLAGPYVKRTRFTDRCAVLSYADALRVISPWNKVFKPLIDSANVYPRIWVMNENGWHEILGKIEAMQIFCLFPFITPNCYDLVCFPYGSTYSV